MTPNHATTDKAITRCLGLSTQRPRRVRHGLLLLALPLAMVFSGCQSQSSSPPADQPTPAPEQQGVSTVAPDPLTLSRAADQQRGEEVERVELMARDRRRYREQLDELIRFYDQQGNQLKLDWARKELEALEAIPQREYLRVAEIAGPDLRARKALPEADMLYDKAMTIEQDASGLVANWFANKQQLLRAVDRYNEIIRRFPDSDKIDDAAYRIGRIYHRYMKDYITALVYYQRVWQWDPQTPLPVRFAVAEVYDQGLNDHARAIEFYRKAINLESAYPENLQTARYRIQELQKDLPEK